MLKRIVKCLRGQVQIRAESVFPERVLNLCGARDLAFWDVSWESPTAFTCRLSRRDWRRLKQAAANLDCTLTVVGREGAPYFLSRFRRRQALLAGLLACALGLFLGSFFIWDFTIEGAERVPEERILRALEKNGVKLGTFGLSLDGETLRNRVLLDIPELIWISVNVSGCRANVQVRERVMPPEPRALQDPANVVARRPGLVLRVRAAEGVAAVTQGSAVETGQLLISGVEDTETVGARILAGMGSVTARTWYTLTAKTPLRAAQKRYTGEEKTTAALILGSRRIKFFSNSSIAGAKYDKITNRRPLTLLGVSLPVTVVTETYRFYEPETVSLSQEEAERRTEAVLTRCLGQMVEPYGEIRSTLCASRERDGLLEVTLSAECVEEIGVRTPIYTEEIKE